MPSQDCTPSELDNRVMVITHMCVTGVATTFRRIPIGIYTSILIGNQEYRTVNKHVCLESGTVQWTDHFRLPPDTSTTIELRIYASFELGPMLGRGGLLHKLSISVWDLIERSHDARPILFLPREGESLASCSSLEVNVCPTPLEELNSLVLSSPVATGSHLERWMNLSTDLGHCHMLRYYRELQDIHLDKAIVQYEKVVDRCPQDHGYRSAALSNLAMAKFVSCIASGTGLNLDIPISLYREALDPRPNNHPDHPFTLINLASALSSRFNRRGNSVDAQEAGELLMTVLDTHPADSYEHRCALLVVEGFGVHSREDHTVNLNIVAPGSSAAPAHCQLPYSLSQLHHMLEECDQRDDPHLLDDVISGYRHAEAYYVIGQPEGIALRGNLAVALRMRFERGGREDDLDDTIKHNQDLLLWTTAGHPHRSDLLNNLANGLTKRFERRGDINDLDEAIKHHCDALSLTSIGHPGYPSYLNNVACALKRRFEQRGDCNDLDEAIGHYRHVLSLTPIGHPHRPSFLSNLAGALKGRSEQRGGGNDLEEAIQHHREALLLRPAGHPDRSVSLSSLARTLKRRFEQRGDSNDLDEAIQHHRDALSLISTGHPHHSAFLHDLANVLRFGRRGDGSDIDEAIQCHRAALSFRPIGHPDYSTSLDNLAVALKRRFEQRGDNKDLDEAVGHYRHALSLTSVGHPQRSSLLSNLATGLQTRFGQQGDSNDLDEAIRHYRAALSLTPIEHPSHSTYLNNLACALGERFELRGNDDDLDKAIEHHRHALSLTPAGHSLLSPLLNNLGNGLTRRFEQRGNVNDLDEAVRYHRDALLLRPAGHPDRPMSLDNLAGALRRRFEQQGNDTDLNEAIQLYCDALSLRPIGHAHHSLSLNNFAGALMIRFEQRGDSTDLNQVVQSIRDALSFQPVGHCGRLTSLNNLVCALLRRFEHQASEGGVDEALQLCRTADAESPPGHPIRFLISRRSAAIHLALWQVKNIDTHLHSAMTHYRKAAGFEPAGLLARLQLCLTWVDDAEKHGHESSLEAYTMSLQLLDIHISAAVSVSARHMVMRQFPPFLSVDAASCSLRRGNVVRALELLEQGRALLWNQMLRCRTSLDDLRSLNAHAEALAKRFQELSLQLDRQPTDEFEPSTGDLSKVTAEAEANHHRRLVDEWNKVVEEIRSLDGYSRFLLPPLFSELQEAACEGPVIVLVASNFTCDAIIVLYDRPPVHIVLDTTLQKLVGLANQLRKKTYLSSDPQRSPVHVLRQLWNTVMLPVMSKLEEFIQRGSRIWWCPTSIFTAFPLHAVGEYRKTSKRSVAVYVSSYTPSLSALIKARKSKLTSSPVHFAAVAQALPDGRRVPLQFVDRELDDIELHLHSTTTTFTKLPSAVSTKQQALHALQTNPWIHFSCHGSQNFHEPFKSHLSMRDGPLSLLDIVNTDLSKHEFAFLSACKTAVGDLDKWDESIHLAAGLHFLGVKSVIGTLWSVDDNIAYRMALKFYKQFCSGDEMDSSRAARALHNANVLLARDKVPLEDRLMFIHIGI